MSAQQQVQKQKPKPAPKPDPGSPTVSREITKKWFS